MSFRHGLLAVLVMLLWGVNFVVIDEGLAGVPPFLFLAMRFVLVALPLVFFVPRPTAPWQTVVAIGGSISLGQFSLLYLGLHLGMPAGLASLVVQAQLIFTIVIATVALREPPTRRQAIGAVIGTIGLIVVVVAHGAAAPVVPALVVLAGSMSWAIGNVITRSAGVSSGLSLVVWSALVVPLPALGLSFLVDGSDETIHALTHLSGVALASTAYTAIGSSVIGYGIWNSLLARYPASAVVPFVLLVPIVGIATAWIVQHEVPTALELVGGAVMLAGVAAATVSRHREVATREERIEPCDPVGIASPTR